MITEGLADDLEAERLDDWRTWNAARAAARESVIEIENAAELRALADGCG